MNWVYISSEPDLYTVGFHHPDGKWEPESDHASSEEAAQRVRWLNGGSSALSEQEEKEAKEPVEMKFFANGKRITPEESQKYINSKYWDGDPPDLTKAGSGHSRAAGWILSWMPVTGKEAPFPTGTPEGEKE